MRSNIIAGNWKMNNDKNKTKELIMSINEALQKKSNLRVIIAPSHVHLESAILLTKDSFIEVSAQNMHHKKSGAYTGEISALMLLSVGVKSVIIGHSERRAFFKEDDLLLTEKVKLALDNNMEVIFCLGEELEDRKKSNHFNIVSLQINNVLSKIDSSSLRKIIIAYEPVWAIGTGETATADQAQEMHLHIRRFISDKYGEDLAQSISIIYGGSVKPENASEIFSKADVDGGLIGGASLNFEDFLKISNSF